MKKFAVIGIAVVVFVLAAGATPLVLIPQRKVTNDVYARICAEITRKQLVRPSSMEIIDALVGDPENLSQKDTLETISPGLIKYKELYNFKVEGIKSVYTNGSSFKTIHAFIKYSGINGLGGAATALSECVFREEPDRSQNYQSKIVEVILNGHRIDPVSVDWILQVKAENLDAAGAVATGLNDRIRYLTGRTLTD